MMNQQNRSGLTLIELLVVIVVISILIAALLPAIQNARVSARRMTCTNRMKQMGIALQAYASTHNGRFPKTKDDNGWEIRLDPDEYVSGDSHVIGGTAPSSIEIIGESTLIPSLTDYVENVDSTFLCPNDLVRHDTYGTGPKTSKPMSSYVLNGYLTALASESKNRALNMNQVGASKTIAMFEANNLIFDYVSSHEWFDAKDEDQDGTTSDDIFKKIRYQVDTRRHVDAANYLYVDGHVDRIAEQQIRDWCEAGDNFALPRR